MCKNAIQFVLGIFIDQFIFLNKHLFVYSYTAKSVLDLSEIRKARFSHDEAHLSKIIQCNYSYLHENYWSQFAKFTFIVQE